MSSPTPQAAAPGGEEDAPPPPPPPSTLISTSESWISADVGDDEDEAVLEEDFYEYDTTSSGSYSNSTDDDDDDEDDRDDGTDDEVSDNCCCVCMEPWTSGGKHRVCCVPCGHVYGRSCLLRWLRRCRRRGMAAKCPQCCQLYERDQIINLYSTTVCHRKGCPHEKAMVDMVSGARELKKNIGDMRHMVTQLLQDLMDRYTPDEMAKDTEHHDSA